MRKRENEKSAKPHPETILVEHCYCKIIKITIGLTFMLYNSPLPILKAFSLPRIYAFIVNAYKQTDKHVCTQESEQAYKDAFTSTDTNVLRKHTTF